MSENNKLNNDSSETVDIPVIDEETKNKFSLILYHDSLDVTTIHISNILKKFNLNFNHIYIYNEDNLNLGAITDEYSNVKVVNNLKPVNLETEWSLILEPGEFPSIQLLQNLKDIVINLDEDIQIVRLPIVICNFSDGEIIDVLQPMPRIFKQKPHILKGKEKSSEKTVDDFPIVKIYVDFEELSKQN